MANKQVINVFQLLRENYSEVMDYYKAGYYTTPPMRAITGVRFPDGTICKYGEWAIQFDDESFCVMTDEQFQKLFLHPIKKDDTVQVEGEWILPTDDEVENWFEENIGTVNKCSASSAIFKFRQWLKNK